MSMNKYMHPRNIYKTPPNFKQLAISYPEFRKYTKQELSGKVSIDFKDPAALRALTTTLLLKDFNLTVEIPLSRLIPTLPLRLNYLLWIEDLLQASDLVGDSQICGIDIGTGASCIYPLLSAKSKGWRMLATEMDEESVECAKQNVLRNNLGHLIEVIKVGGGTILNGVISKENTYDFTMCNPPFFGSEKELLGSDNRSTNRTPPSNSLTGTVGELVVDGGETGFIKSMVKESANHGERVRLFTTMVGHKSNVALLKREIIAAGACSVGSYELCQGRTTRWVLAWTFNSDVKTTADGITASKKSMSKPPFKFLLPRKEENEYTIDAFSVLVKEILVSLEMEYKQIKKSKNMLVYGITAWKDKWSKQRQKRRAAQSKNRDLQKITVQAKEVGEPLHTCVGEGNGQSEELNSECPELNKRPRMDSNLFSQLSQEQAEVIKCTEYSERMESNLSTHSAQEQNDVNRCTTSETMKCNSEKGMPLLKSSLVIHRVSSDIFLELAWLEGLNGRDVLHQVLQYFKNHLGK